MVVLAGHFDGKQVIIDGPLPADIPVNTPLRVTLAPVDADPEPSDPLADIAALARPLGKPRDFAAQHEHYIKGTPKR